MNLAYKNINVNYTIDGKGDAVVLLHGFLESVAMWNDLTQELSKTHIVICIDLLGHGKTDCLGYLHTMEEMANAVFAVLNHLKIKKAHFVGHSMGGYVALALAEQKPDLFKSLCLMNSTFEADDDERKALRKRANQMAQTSFENLVRMSFTNLFAPESKLKFETEFEIALELALKTSVQGYIAGQEGMRIRPNRFEVFKTLNVKKAILIGKKDWIVNAELLKTKTQNIAVDIVEFSEGHMSHIENKTDLTNYIKKFLRA